MSPLASLLLIGALVAVAFTLAARAITNASNTITSALAELDQPTNDRTLREWVRIQAEYSPDEFELLRRADRMMAGVEAAVIRDWQDMPYDHETGGL